MDNNYLWITCDRQYRENVTTKNLDYFRNVTQQYSTILQKGSSYTEIAAFIETLRNEYNIFNKAFKKEPNNKSVDICIYLYTERTVRTALLYRMGVFGYWETDTKVFYKDVNKEQVKIDLATPYTSDYVINDIASKISELLKMIP